MTDLIATTTMRDNLSDTLGAIEKKSKKYMLITDRGKKIRAALVNLDFFEDLLALASPKYLKDIKKSRNEIKNGEFSSHEEIFGEL